MKRDDLLSFGLGGNKVRKMQTVAAEAGAAGCDTLITCGGMQSNHARVTAAAGAALGLRVILVLNGAPPGGADRQRPSRSAVRRGNPSRRPPRRPRAGDGARGGRRPRRRRPAVRRPARRVDSDRRARLCPRRRRDRDGRTEARCHRARDVVRRHAGGTDCRVRAARSVARESSASAPTIRRRRSSDTSSPG